MIFKYESTSQMTFITEANKFGNESGDEQLHDEYGNFIIPKIEISTTDEDTGSGIEIRGSNSTQDENDEDADIKDKNSSEEEDNSQTQQNGHFAPRQLPGSEEEEDKDKGLVNKQETATEPISQEPVDRSNQENTPEPSTSRGQSSLAVTCADQRSVQAMLKESSPEETDGEQKTPKESYAILQKYLGEILDDNGEMAHLLTGLLMTMKNHKCKGKGKSSAIADENEQNTANTQEDNDADILKDIQDHINIEPGQLIAPHNETPNEQESSIEEPPKPHHELELGQQTVPQKETTNDDHEPSVKEPSEPHPEENNNNDWVKLLMPFRAINETTEPDQGHRQLIIKGIKTEFPLLTDTFESKETREAVIDLHMRLKVISVQDGDIVAAAPTVWRARNNSHAPIKITISLRLLTNTKTTTTKRRKQRKRRKALQRRAVQSRVRLRQQKRD